MPIHGFPGGVISSTAVTPSVSSASGVWTLDEQLQAGANWPVAPSFVNNSVRLRSSASAYMNRTPAVAGNQKTWTWSGWVKRGALGETALASFGASSTTDGYVAIYFTSSDTLTAQVRDAGSNKFKTTTQVFRDPSSWYHIVFAVDTTQATAGNRIKVYVNGSQVTSFSADDTITQNLNTSANNTVSQQIGAGRTSGGSFQQYYDGYLTDVNFIDGQALTPNYFGAIDAATGVWEPATYRGTYGTNGFYLPFNVSTTSTFGGFTGDISSSFNTLPTGSQGSTFQFSGDFTIEGWVLFPSASTGDNSFYVSSDGSGFLALNIDVAGGSYNIYMNSGVPTAIISSDIKAGSWAHVAMVRSGSTVTLYTNGAVRGSFTNSSTVGYSTLTLNRFGGGASGQRYLSNVRAVKAAVYTSAFTPPTSPLTSIANTLFLTYQNSTAIDNGPNAFAIGTTGTVTFSTQYPFTLNIASDRSGNGNNWTPINISLANNSTFDSMTDVPTLTSATASNFAVLNPLNASPSYTYNGGNLNLVFDAASDSHATTTMTVTSGTWYAEGVLTASGGNSLAGGFCVLDGNLQWNNANASSSGRIEYRLSGAIIYNGSTVATVASYTTNDVISITIDATNNQVKFYKNNTLQHTQSSMAFGSYMFGYYGNGGSGRTMSTSFNFGQRPFTYTPPTGFVALNTFNLPTPTIGATASTQANKYFDATTYTGTGSSNTIVNAGSFPPALVWLKRRSAAESHGLWDTVRGGSLRLESNTTGAESNTTDRFSGITSTGFTVTSADPQTNASGSTYVGWQWRGSDSSAVTNTAGSITSTVSANTSSGFSVVTWTGSSFGSSTTVGHGLGVAPSMIIIKARSTTEDWYVYHSSLGLTKFLRLNLTDAVGTATNLFNTVNSTVFNPSYTSTLGITNVAYCFSEIAGYSKFGSYTGNGSADGPFVFTGFRPKYVLVKASSTTGGWNVVDATRSPSNIVDDVLFPNLSDAEGTFNWMDFTSNGFKIRNTLAGSNTSGTTYIYMAFAESPFKYANAR
jgi:hypothetical protein